MIGRKRKLSTAVIILSAAALLLFIISACDDFSFYTKLDGAGGLQLTSPGGTPDEVLTIIPENAVLPIDTNFTFSAEGGLEPYSYSITSGSGTIDAESGLYRAPSVPGQAVIAVIDGYGSVVESEIEILAVGEFTISPTSISLYIYNTTTFSVIGGVAPFSWAMVSGGGTIDGDTGAYTAPSSPGADVVRVTDSIGNSSDAEITVFEPFAMSPSEIQITVDNTYSFSVEGGKPPYVFSMFSGTGSIDPDTGEYTAPSAADTDVVRAVDSLGNIDSAEITVIPAAGLLILPASITLNINDATVFSATGGTPPYQFTILSGDGSIDINTGDYTAWSAPGSNVVRLTDNLGAVSTAFVTIVSGGPLSVVPTAVQIEQDDSYNFSADGGSPPYIYSITAGSGTINSSSGIFTASAAIGSSTVRVTDSLGAFDESNVTIAPAAPTDLIADGTVPGPGTLTISWTDNADGEAGFIIERKLGFTGVYAVIDSVGPDVESYPDSGLTPNEVYGYRVKAYSGPVESEYSNEAYDFSNSP